MEPLNVTVMGGHPLVRAGLAAVLERHPCIQVAMRHSPHAPGLRANMFPEVILAGCRRDEVNGAASSLRRAYPDSGIVLFGTWTHHYPYPNQSSDMALHVAQRNPAPAVPCAGHPGVWLLNEWAQPEEIVAAVLEAAEQPGSRDANSAGDHLTPREHEVLRLVGLRWDAREIADALGISYQTVRSHLRNIYAKCGVRTRREAARMAAGLNVLVGFKSAPIHPSEWPDDK